MLYNILRKIVNIFNKMYGNLQQFGPPEQNSLDTGVIGKWTKIHPQFDGPNTVYVRDMIMDGENMVVITNDGQMDMGVFSNHYIKQSDEEYDNNGNVIASSPEQHIEPNYNDFIEKSDIDYDLLTAGMGQDVQQPEIKDYVPADARITSNVIETHSSNNVEQYSEQSSINIEVRNVNTDIEKVFSKIDSKPNIVLSIEWDKFPAMEIDMLTKYFDVTLEDIADYIVDNYFDNKEIKKVVTKHLEEKMA